MPPTEIFVHETAEVPASAAVGEGTCIWHQAQLMNGVKVGTECVVGKGAFLGSGTMVGNMVKIGNYSNIFGAHLEDEVFIGPQVCVLEDPAPRSTVDGRLRGSTDFARLQVSIRRGATLGAAAVIFPGVTVGAWAMVSAGSVVHKDVPDHAIVAGNPARLVGSACVCGLRLASSLVCQCGRVFERSDSGDLAAATRTDP